MINKQYIIKTGFRLFQEKGYDNVSMDDICQACQLTKATFYKYVDSTENILHYHFQQITEELIECTKDKEPNLDLLWTMLTFPLQKNIEIGPELYSKYIILHLHGQTLSGYFLSNMKELTIQSIQIAQASGQIKNTSDPEQLYCACRNLSGSYAILWCIKKGGFDLIQTVEEAVRTILLIEKN